MRLIILVVMVFGLAMGEDRPGVQPPFSSAIDEGLRFLARHQSSDGRWDVDGYHTVTAGGGAEPGIGGDDADAAVTAVVLLTFLGAGHHHSTPGPYAPGVARGLAWLLSTQRADGGFPGSLTDHCLAVMVVCEAMLYAQDGSLREPATRGVEFILARQVRDPDQRLSGWGDPLAKQIDTRVTTYAVMALRTARAGGLDFPDTLEGARRWLRDTWLLANPAKDIAAMVFPATISLPDRRPSGSAPAYALACADLLRAGNGSLIAHGLARTCAEAFPTDATPITDIEAMWFATFGIFHVDGTQWKRWKEGGRAAVCKAQCRDPAPLRGSWSAAGQVFPGHARGRLLSTAFGVLINEVFYIYDPVMLEGPIRETFPDGLDPAP
jgi:hypothetical protein